MRKLSDPHTHTTTTQPPPTNQSHTHTLSHTHTHTHTLSLTRVNLSGGYDERTGDGASTSSIQSLKPSVLYNG